VQLDPAIDQIVMKAVAKDKEQRYPTAEAFGDAMLGYLHHRAKSSGPSEISRFFDQHFGQEIEEHGERMRELIAGRADSLDLSWGVEEDEKKANETVDLGAKDIETVDGDDVIEIQTGDASLDALVDDLGGDGDDDENQPAEKTRIESNPLELLEQLNNQGKTPVPQGTGSGVAPLPAPPTAPHKSVVGAKASGKFPDLANLPTQIAEDTPPPQKVGAEHAPTAIGGQTMEPQPPVVAPGQPMGQPFVPPSGPQSSTQYAVRASAMQQAMPQMPNKALPTDYPVMAGGRPFNADLAPSDLGSPQRAPMTPNTGNVQQAMNIMSPVGEQFPQTDWDAAAAQSAKALPHWKLALLFLAVVGGALLLTTIIVKIAHH
jgi:hypothetical protein